MKASKRDRISSEPKKKRGLFSRLIRGTVELFVIIIIGLSVIVGSFIDSPDRPKKTVVAVEKNQPPIPKAKPVMVASIKPIKKKVVVAISDNDIKCYAAFSLMRDVYFSTEWSSTPNGSFITESAYREFTDIQNNMDIAIGQTSEHRAARRKSLNYKKTLMATPDKTMVDVMKCVSLYG